MTCNPNVIPLEFISRGGNGGWFEMGLHNLMDARYMKNYTGKSEMSSLTQGIRRDQEVSHGLAWDSIFCCQLSVRWTSALRALYK